MLYHPKVSALIWLCLVSVLAILSTRTLTKDWLETGFLAMLPASEQQPEIADTIKQHNTLRDRKVLWLIGANSVQTASDQAKLLLGFLHQSGLFKADTEHNANRISAAYQQLFPYRYQLLATNSRQKIQQDPREFLNANLSTIYNPAGQLALTTLQHDPLLLLNQYLQTLLPKNFKVYDGIPVFARQNRHFALLATDLNDDHLLLDKLEKLTQVVEEAQAQINAKKAELFVTGMPLFTAYGADAAKREISTIGLGSSLAIVVLMAYTFRSLRPLTLSFLAIGTGLFAAIVVCVFTFGKIHLITLIFGASLIGVADDYALHFFCDSVGELKWQPQHALRYLFPGLVIGLLTNLASYSGLMISTFPVLQQVALFSSVGLLGAWLTVVLLFPLFLSGFNGNDKSVIFKLTDHWQQHWPSWLIAQRTWLIPLLTVFILAGIWQLSPNDDVRLLQEPPEKLRDAAERIKQLTLVTQENQFFLVTGDNFYAWLKNEQQLLSQLEKLRQHQQLLDYQGITTLWPDEQSQKVNYQLLDKHLYKTGLVQSYMANLGFSKAYIEYEISQFNQARDKVLSLTNWLSLTDESKSSLWQGCESGTCKSRVALSGIKDVAALTQLGQLPGVAWVDQVSDLSQLFQRYRYRATFLLAIAFILVTIGLGLKFGWRNALTITAIPVVSVLVSLAMSGWFGQLFSLFNVFALLLVLGIGIDDAIFFFMASRPNQQENTSFYTNKRDTTALAVTLSALTTILAFGLLSASSTEIVHAFGFTVASGIVAAFLLSPLIGANNANTLG